MKAKGSSAAEGGGEKMLRAMQLIDPDIDPEAVFATSAAADDTLDEDGLAADEDDQAGGQGLAGILDRSRWQVGKSVMRQACELLEEMGPDGISQQDVGKKMGMEPQDHHSGCSPIDSGSGLGFSSTVGRYSISRTAAGTAQTCVSGRFLLTRMVILYMGFQSLYPLPK